MKEVTKLINEAFEDLDSNPLGMPEELWDEIKGIMAEENPISYKELVEYIMDTPQGRNWFRKYKGNEFDLRQELEDILTQEEE